MRPERARRELRAAGATARRRAVTTTVKLTAQETQIARLAVSRAMRELVAARDWLRTYQLPPSCWRCRPAGQESRPATGTAVSRGAPNQRESASRSAGTPESAGSPAVAAQAM